MRLKNSELALTAKKDRPSITTYLKDKESPGFLAVLFSVAIVISLPMLCVTMIAEYDSQHSNLCDELERYYGYQEVSPATIESYQDDCKGYGWFDTSPTEEFGIDPQINSGFATESNFGPDGAFYWIGYSFLSLFLLCGLGSYVSRDFRQRKALAKAERKQLSIVRKLALDPDGVVEGRIVLPEPVPESVPKKYEIRVVKLIITMMAGMILFSIVGFASEVFADRGFGVKREAEELALMIFGAYIAGTFAVATTCFIIGHLTLMTMPGEEESLIPKSMIKESPVEQKEENILPYEAKKLEQEKQEKDTQTQNAESKSQINDWEVEEDGWDIDPTILNTLISCFLIIGPMFVIIVTGGDEIRLVIGGYVVKGIALMLSMILGGLSMWVFILATLVIRWCHNNEIYPKIINGTGIQWDTNVKLFLGALAIINAAIFIILPVGFILLGFEVLFLLELRKRYWKSQLVTENQDGTWSKKKEKKAARKREGPVTMNEIVSVMEAKLAEAIAEAESLKVDLVHTQEKVVTLEREVVSKDFDIIELEEVKEQIEVELKEKMEKMEKVREKETEDSSDGEVRKELSLQDSVMVGDALFGSTKIDKQIVNDPEAIARAAIAAYRQGKEESGHKRPDILL